MATFSFQIIDNSFLEDPKGLALVFWCSYGKQRSTAVAGVFRHCMERYGWGRLFGRSHTRSESKPEITLLSWKVYEADSCGIMPCPQCDDRISGRTGSDLRTAYDIWCQVSTFYKRQRSDWMWRLISPCCMLGWAPINCFVEGLSPGSVLAVCWAEPQLICVLLGWGL